ncbi:MAG TPA: hypothetical protein VLA34_15080, partial [Candidatus Krumholzibacterium sp.]|nr:hypothetical protein [Candidatus Krumholzibacterium sp.]
SIENDEQNAKKYIAEIAAAYEELLEIMPDDPVVLMSLVELYGDVPAEMGGDPSKAAEYASRLAGADDLMACKAHCIIMPEDFDRVGFWEEILKKKPSDASVLEELGKTCMREGKTEKGTECLEKAMEADPSRTTLLLDIARHQIMKSRQDPSIKEDAIAKAIVAVDRFLKTEPIVPLKAYALGMLARLNYAKGDRSEGDRFKDEAESLDPYFSKASAIPSADLFDPPGVFPRHHSYMFRPM